MVLSEWYEVLLSSLILVQVCGKVLHFILSEDTYFEKWMQDAIMFNNIAVTGFFPFDNPTEKTGAKMQPAVLKLWDLEPIFLNLMTYKAKMMPKDLKIMKI